MQTFLSRFLQDRSAATAIEYALIASGIAAAIFAIIGQLSGSVVAQYELVDKSFK